MYSDRWKREIGHEKWFKREKSNHCGFGLYLCGCGLRKFAHTQTQTHICKHRTFCSPVNFKSPSSHGYHYAIQIREEKNPLRLHCHISETTPQEAGRVGQRCIQMSVRRLKIVPR